MAVSVRAEREIGNVCSDYAMKTSMISSRNTPWWRGSGKVNVA